MHDNKPKRNNLNPNSSQRDVIKAFDEVFSELDALDNSADMIEAFLNDNNKIKVKKNG